MEIVANGRTIRYWRLGERRDRLLGLSSHQLQTATQVGSLAWPDEEEEEEDCLRGPKLKQQVAVLRTCDAYKYATDAKCRHRCEQTTTTYHTLLALLGKTYGQHTDRNPVAVDRESRGVPPLIP
ncbi:hypothetical protein DFH09DRAFT_1353193 [Mycena vulgaris]|nr:hypothetical protein DFH09DRAFT_1353193 [Mycena vulgaris]